jgi:hypothetical protein
VINIAEIVSIDLSEREISLLAADKSHKFSFKEKKESDEVYEVFKQLWVQRGTHDAIPYQPVKVTKKMLWKQE